MWRKEKDVHTFSLETQSLARDAANQQLTLDLPVLSTAVLLRLGAHYGSGLSADSRHGDGRDLVDNVHRLHDGGGVTRRGYDGWRRHGVGHRLHGRLRHLALHGDQYRLVAEGRACPGGKGGVYVFNFFVSLLQMSPVRKVAAYRGSSAQSGPLG